MFLWLDITGWTAILAFATVLLSGVTVWVTLSSRHHDDTKRRKDRKRDAKLRDEERKRDDRLRLEESSRESMRQLRAAQEAMGRQRAEEDREARQVLVQISQLDDPESGPLAPIITVSTPHLYPIKQVEVQYAYSANGGIAIYDADCGRCDIDVNEVRTYYIFRASEGPDGATPIVRWVDWHGNRYYQYRHYTDRFSQNDDWPEAAVKIDKWIRTGPKPD